MWISPFEKSPSLRDLAAMLNGPGNSGTGAIRVPADAVVTHIAQAAKNHALWEALGASVES